MRASRAALGIALASAIGGCGGSSSTQTAARPAPLPVEQAAPDPSWTNALSAANASDCQSVAFAADGSVVVVGATMAETSTQMIARVTRETKTIRAGNPGLFTDVHADERGVMTTGLETEGYDDFGVVARYSDVDGGAATTRFPGDVIGMTFEDILPVADGYVVVGAMNPPVSGQFWARIARVTHASSIVFERTFREPGYNAFAQAAALESDVVVVGSVGTGGAYDATFARLSLTDGSVRHRARTSGPAWEMAVGVTVSGGGIRAVGLVQPDQPRTQYDAQLAVWTLDGAMNVTDTRTYREHVTALTRAITIGEDLVVAATARMPDGVARSFVVRIARDGTDSWTEVPGPDGMQAVAVDASPAHGVAFLGDVRAPNETRCHIAVIANAR